MNFRPKLATSAQSHPPLPNTGAAVGDGVLPHPSSAQLETSRNNKKDSQRGGRDGPKCGFNVTTVPFVISVK